MEKTGGDGMRKSIVVLIVAVLAVAAGAVVLSLSAPVLDEEIGRAHV